MEKGMNSVETTCAFLSKEHFLSRYFFAFVFFIKSYFNSRENSALYFVINP